MERRDSIFSIDFHRFSSISDNSLIYNEVFILFRVSNLKPYQIILLQEKAVYSLNYPVNYNSLKPIFESFLRRITLYKKLIFILSGIYRESSHFLLKILEI